MNNTRPLTEVFLLHLHNNGGVHYRLYFSTADAMSAVVHYDKQWWAQELNDPLPDPLTLEDVQFYFSDTHEWFNIVHLTFLDMYGTVIPDADAWGNWLAEQEK